MKASLAATAVLALAGIAVTAAPASAAAGGGVTMLKNRGTQKCLDSRADSVYTKSCKAKTLNQQWLVVAVDGTNLVIQNLATARCLDSNAAGAVYTMPCNTKNHYQQWKGSGPSLMALVSRATGRALDSNWHQAGHPDPDLGEVYTLTPNGGENQNWNILANA